MRQIFYREIIISLSAVIALSCSSPNESNPAIDHNNSYTPLYNGIIKEYINYEDSLQVVSEIVGNVIREDGQKLFITEYKYFRYKSDGEMSFNQYYFYHYLKEDLLIESSIIKSDDKDNPFGDIVFEKSNPNEGESWNLYPNNSTKTDMNVSTIYIGEMETPAGIFQDVYCFQLIDTVHFMDPDTMQFYNAKGIGNIARNISGNKIFVNYVKTKDTEYGERISLF